MLNGYYIVDLFLNIATPFFCKSSNLMKVENNGYQKLEIFSGDNDFLFFA